MGWLKQTTFSLSFIKLYYYKRIITATALQQGIIYATYWNVSYSITKPMLPGGFVNNYGCRYL